MALHLVVALKCQAEEFRKAVPAVVSRQDVDECAAMVAILWSARRSEECIDS